MIILVLMLSPTTRLERAENLMIPKVLSEGEDRGENVGERERGRSK